MTLRGPSSSLPLVAAYYRRPIDCLIPLAERYGDPFILPGKVPLVVSGHPEGIEQIYSADPATFAPLNQDAAFLLGNHSVLLQHGAEHKRARRLLTPPFHGQKVRAAAERIATLAAEALERWPEGEVQKALTVGQRISLEVILRVVFGVEGAKDAAALGEALLAVLHGISPLFVLLPASRRPFFGIGPWDRFERKRIALREALDAVITARRAEQGGDVLSLLLAAKGEDGEGMSDEEVRDQLLTIVIAGHETTGTAIAWALYALHRPENQATLSTLRAELDAAPQDPERWANLPYLDAVVKESLRRFPGAPAPAPRLLLKPMTLRGHDLQAGVAVAAGIGLAHFREASYPEPFAFRPERFLGRTPGPFEFLPFGGGARRCLGATLALWETKVCLATFLRGAEFELRLRGEDIGAPRAASVAPKSGIPLALVRRRAQPA